VGRAIGGEPMTDETFDLRLAELEARVADLAPEQLAAVAPLLEETRQRHAEIRLNVAKARDALDDWRIAMKYKVFDTEARRREDGH